MDKQQIERRKRTHGIILIVSAIALIVFLLTPWANNMVLDGSLITVWVLGASFMIVMDKNYDSGKS